MDNGGADAFYSLAFCVLLFSLGAGQNILCHACAHVEYDIFIISSIYAYRLFAAKNGTITRRNDDSLELYVVEHHCFASA
jgi:hypothetical protein